MAVSEIPDRDSGGLGGLGLQPPLMEAGLRIVLALSLTTSVFLLVWPVLSYGIYAALLVWTVSYTRVAELTEDAVALR